MATGTVSGVTDRRIQSDLILPHGQRRRPGVQPRRALVGLTSRDEDSGDRQDSDARIIRTGQICEVLASAEKRLAEVTAPPGTRLPVEPARAYAVDG